MHGLLEAGWRRGGFGDTDEERQLHGKARAALERYFERFRSEDVRAGLVRAPVLVPPRPAPAARARRPRRPPARRRLRAHRLQDRPPEDAGAAARRRAARASTRSPRARRGTSRPSQQSYHYVLDDEKVPLPPGAVDRDWISRHGLQRRRGDPRRRASSRRRPTRRARCATTGSSARRPSGSRAQDAEAGLDDADRVATCGCVVPATARRPARPGADDLARRISSCSWSSRLGDEMRRAPWPSADARSGRRISRCVASASRGRRRRPRGSTSRVATRLASTYAAHGLDAASRSRTSTARRRAASRPHLEQPVAGELADARVERRACARQVVADHRAR